MKRRLTKQAANAFQNRWRIVATEETKLRRRETPARKLQQLNRLWVWGQEFGTKRLKRDDVTEVRRRWLKLQQIYRGSTLTT